MFEIHAVHILSFPLTSDSSLRPLPFAKAVVAAAPAFLYDTMVSSLDESNEDIRFKLGTANVPYDGSSDARETPPRWLQSWWLQMLELAWETWADAITRAAIVRQRLKRLQGRCAAAVVNAWVGVAYLLRRRRGLAQRAAVRMRGRTLSAAWNEWVDKAQPAVEEDEDKENPSQATTIPPLLYYDAIINNHAVFLTNSISAFEGFL